MEICNAPYHLSSFFADYLERHSFLISQFMEGKEIATDFTDYTDTTAPSKEFSTSESVQSVKSVASFLLDRNDRNRDNTIARKRDGCDCNSLRGSHGHCACKIVLLKRVEPFIQKLGKLGSRR
jgi:hypothetical protein